MVHILTTLVILAGNVHCNGLVCSHNRLLCRVGAAIVVEADPPVIPPVFRNIYDHSLCFLQYSDPIIPFQSLNLGQVSMNLL